MDVHAIVTKDRAGIRGVLRSLLALGVALGAWCLADAQSVPAPVLITAPIDDARTVTLEGNTRPEANAANDGGRVPDSLALPHLQLLLKRPAQRESALQLFIAQLHDRRSPNFHRWLGAAEFARRFGLSQPDLAAVVTWLGQNGFVVNTVYPGDTVIDFSGTAGAVRSAFHTEIHAFTVAGVRHIANMTNPQIPAALAPAVAGIVSLHDFRPHAMNRPRAKFTTSTGSTLVAPADLATIYNLNPLFSKGLAGQNQTIVVIEDTDVFATADWTTFRNTFGLSSFTTGSFTQVHPAPAGGSNNCVDPGVLGTTSFEAILDAEWASAAAPAAAIELASCASTTTFGGLIALQNLVNQPTRPAIVSISYGECEAENGATGNAAFSSVYEQAVTEGGSIFVAAGDEGGASCDPSGQFASHGIGVSGYASTVYNVAVGGTDFGDTFAGTTAAYWSATNSATFGSALSYVPEIPWNDSCAGSLVDSFEGFSTAYSTSSTTGFCNSTGGSSFLTTSAGSGGPSGCASGAPRTGGVVGGSCAGTPKPSWQSGVPGIPNDGVRDLPDVSMFASNGFWSHFYVVCWSDTAATGGAPCTGVPSGWSGGGGTSFASPILAGIQALVNQSTGARTGNPNFVYYTLAASQSAGGLACNASSGNAVAGGCVFHDVTQGDMDIDCRGSIDCFLPTGTNGALFTGSGAFSTAYAAAAGWDFATGIGSINAYTLVQYWNSSDLALSGHGSVTAGGQLQYALTIRDAGPQSAAAVMVTATLPPGLTLAQGSSSAGCTPSGATPRCAAGTLAVGSPASLNLVLQPTGAAQTFNLTFTAGSANADLDPGDGVDSISLTSPGQTTDAPTAVPVPPWATAALGLLLLAIIRRRNSRNVAHSQCAP